MKIIPLKIIVLSFLVLSGFLCFSQDEKPKTIDEAVNYFIKNWSEETKRAFTDTTSGISPVISAHMGTGLWIRNNWIHGRRDTALVNQFHAMEIYAPDDISSIILELVYRRLKKLPENMDSITAPYKEYWVQEKKRGDATKEHAIENYKKFKLGDSIRIYANIDSDASGSRLIHHVYCSPQAYNQKSGIIISGIIVDKSLDNIDSSRAYFEVKVLDMSRKKVAPWLGQAEISFGLIQKFECCYFKMEKY